MLQPAAQLLSASFARVRESGLLVSTAADLPLMPRAGPLRPGDEVQCPNSNPSPNPTPNPTPNPSPNPNPNPSPNQVEKGKRPLRKGRLRVARRMVLAQIRR